VGLCSWTDPELIKSTRFYPKTSKTGIERLQYYSKRFACVEIDTSSYAIPSSQQTESWTKVVGKKFIFHVKAYNIFTYKEVTTSSLPKHIRESLPPHLTERSSLMLNDLNSSLQEKLWQAFVDCLAPFDANNMMGVILFQFPTFFTPSENNKDHMQSCLEFVKPRKMAVEFRSLQWLDDRHKEDTLQFLRHNEIGLVLIDEPQYPIFDYVTSPLFTYVRVHRRHGEHRILSQEQLFKWKEVLLKVREEVKENVFLMWNTNHEDQSIVNARNFVKVMGDEYFLNCLPSEKGIETFFKEKEVDRFEAEKEPLKRKSENDEAQQPSPSKKPKPPTQKSQPLISSFFKKDK